MPSSELGDVVVVGCGNLVRSDDGAGPMLVRRLWELGVPPGVRLADGGTAGMDVAFQLAGAREVAIVDACVSGAEAGTIFEIPGEDVETPPLAGMNLHSFRWDHALAFGRWLLKDRFPPRVTVFLIEAQSVEPGVGLSPPVERSMHEVADELLRRYGAASPAPSVGGFDRNAIRAYSRIERESGMWVVYLDVLFVDGIVRRRIAAYPSREKAEISAKWMQRVADRDLDGPPSGY